MTDSRNTKPQGAMQMKVKVKRFVRKVVLFGRLRNRTHASEPCFVPHISAGTEPRPASSRQNTSSVTVGASEAVFDRRGQGSPSSLSSASSTCLGGNSKEESNCWNAADMEGGGVAVTAHEFSSSWPLTEPPMSSGNVPVVQSPPPVDVEHEVPFLVDDPESPQDNAGVDHSVPISSEISLARPPTSPVLSPNIYKNVPPPPSHSGSIEDDDETPEINLPGLVVPNMFLPIPSTDPLTTLLTKYIYPPDKRPLRDLTGEWQHSDFHTLVMTNSWRSLARMARDRIVTTNPSDLPQILALWYLRLSSLARLRLFNQTSAECTNLFSILNGTEPPSLREYLFDSLVPFELEVLFVRLKYWAGDHMAYLDALNGLLSKCKGKSRAAGRRDPVGAAMWQERGSRVCLIIASQLIEMKDIATAGKLLEPLCEQGKETASSPSLRSAIARIYLQAGYISFASKHFSIVAADTTADQSMKSMNAALLASAEGDWSTASILLRDLVDGDKENYVAVNNLSVALLSQGKLKEGIEVMEMALQSSPSSVVVAEPFLFNLSTLYELRSATAMDKKRDLLVEVAKWSGDGLKTTCLKMPSN